MHSHRLTNDFPCNSLKFALPWLNQRYPVSPQNLTTRLDHLGGDVDVWRASFFRTGLAHGLLGSWIRAGSGFMAPCHSLPASRLRMRPRCCAPPATWCRSRTARSMPAARAGKVPRPSPFRRVAWLEYLDLALS